MESESVDLLRESGPPPLQGLCEQIQRECGLRNLANGSMTCGTSQGPYGPSDMDVPLNGRRPMIVTSVPSSNLSQRFQLPAASGAMLRQSRHLTF